jgi:predicted nucleic acid-binding Zn ribbon protein
MSAERHRITPHAHCKVCGKAVPEGRDYCSNEHRAQEDKAKQRQRRTTRIFMLGFVALMVVILLLNLLAQPPAP